VRLVLEIGEFSADVLLKKLVVILPIILVKFVILFNPGDIFLNLTRLFKSKSFFDLLFVTNVSKIFIFVFFFKIYFFKLLPKKNE
jgi:hypothetical protein